MTPANTPTAEEREGLACPFCGKGVHQQAGIYGYKVWIGCSSADCKMKPSSQFYSEDEALAAWNSRPKPAERPKPALTVEEIEDACRALYTRAYEDGVVDATFPEGSADDGEEIRKAIDPMAIIEGFEQAKESLETISRLTEATSPASGGWMPIESAPLPTPEYPCLYALVVYEGVVGEAVLKGSEEKPEGEWWWANTDSEYGEEIFPTHWQPLPDPPTQPSQEGGAE